MGSLRIYESHNFPSTHTACLPPWLFPATHTTEETLHTLPISLLALACGHVAIEAGPNSRAQSVSGVVDGL